MLPPSCSIKSGRPSAFISRRSYDVLELPLVALAFRPIERINVTAWPDAPPPPILFGTPLPSTCCVGNVPPRPPLKDDPSEARTLLPIFGTDMNAVSRPPVIGENCTRWPDETTSGNRSPFISRKSIKDTVELSDLETEPENGPPSDAPPKMPKVSVSEMRDTALAPAKTDGSGTDG